MTTLEACRACGAPDPYVFLPMGNHPPANMFVAPADAGKVQPAFSLDTAACLECGLIQVADQIPADFFRHYLYVPSGAQTMHGHFEQTAAVIALAAGDGLVVDIGANDGLLLSHCNRLGCRTLGVDPAANLAPLAIERGVQIHIGYFGPESARELLAKHGPARVIVTTNTFNHIGDLDAFMTGVETLLSPDGSFFIEVPMAIELLHLNRFDNIYQEHVSEFSLTSLLVLGARFGLDVTHVDRLKVHGGSMRVQLQRQSLGVRPSPVVGEMLEAERAAGLHDKATYDAFAKRIAGVRKALVAMIDELRAKGLKVAGYGAPAKGNTLLNYFDIGPDRLDFLVDKNPLKQGLLSPGMQIPVHSTDAIAREKPDVLLVLAWNFFDEIRGQQHAFEAQGGRFLVPLPDPVLVP
jgi:hypothetical protein